MIQKRPNGRYAVTVYDPALKRRRQVGTYDLLRDARKAEAAAKLAARRTDAETVATFAARWTRDFPRPKTSTNLHNAERVSDFAAAHGRLRLDQVTPRLVDTYLAEDPRRRQRVPALRAMFNDARRRGLTETNPFAQLGVSRPRGNRDKQPPSQEQVAVMLRAAWEHTPPSFAGWLQCAATTGMRPGELDGLRWADVDLRHDEITVRTQWNAASRTFTAPKNGQARVIAITPPARQALAQLQQLPAASPFAFETIRGGHYTPSSRSHHWNRVRAIADLTGFTLYQATRHYAAWFMVNVLELPAAVVAQQLGHTDGGRLVEVLYGHRERDRSLAQIKQAWAADVTPIRPRQQETG